MKPLDLTGQTFGKLTVLHEGQRITRKVTRVIHVRQWVCRCQCGVVTTVRHRNLQGGRVRSCGCSHFTHGQTGTPEYLIWHAMKQRCMNPRSPQYPNYGGRGIAVCDRWQQSYLIFLGDMGERPSKKHSLDRIDNDGPYSPDNCRWGTREQQNNNKRTNRFLIFHGETLTISQWARRLHVHFCTLQYRLRRGWSVERTLTEPVRQFRHRT